MTGLTLGFGLAFTDLYESAGLEKLDRRFAEWLREADSDLASRLLAARAQPDVVIAAGGESLLLIDLAPHLDDFIGELFGIGPALRQLAARHEALTPLYAAKRLFVQRRAAKAFRSEQAAELDGPALTSELEAHLGIQFDELTFAVRVLDWLGDEPAHAEELGSAARYAAWALWSEEGRKRHGHGVLFQMPAKTDPARLVPVETVESGGGLTVMRLPEAHQRPRQGFGLTDCGTDLIGALDEANYCIECHNQGKDSCSKGLRDRKSGEYQKSPFGVTLAGCPLEEKISEMQHGQGGGASGRRPGHGRGRQSPVRRRPGTASATTA